MKITIENYKEATKKIDFTETPPIIRTMHELIGKVTNDFTNWSNYAKYKSQIDTQFTFIEKFLGKSKPTAKTEIESEEVSPLKKILKNNGGGIFKMPSQNNTTSKTKTESQNWNANPRSQKEEELIEKLRPKTDKALPVKKQSSKTQNNFNSGVALISPEINIIKRYVGLNNKVKSKEQIMTFIRFIQKSATEGKVTLKSRFADLVKGIHKLLVNKFQQMNRPTKFTIDEADLKKCKSAIESETVYDAVKLIKSFISLEGKEVEHKKAFRLFERIKKAFDLELVATSDKYYKHLNSAYDILNKALSKNSDFIRIELTEPQLSGLQQAIGDCGCNGKPKQELNALGFVDSIHGNKNRIVNSNDLVNMKFEKIYFHGKWHNFIGNPSKGFKAVIFGMPKFGKSYLALDFASYLSKNHGRVLYIAYEEGIDEEIRVKLEETQANNPNLDIADYVPVSLKGYDFVFIDSINKARLSDEDLENMAKTNSNIGFVYICQVTKEGKARGSMEIMHNSDILIEVPKKGYAVQIGRYNQGGEMFIFS